MGGELTPVAELLSALLRCPSHRPSRRDGGFDRISEQISQQLCVAIKRKTCRFVGGIDHNAQLAHVALSIVRHANGRFLNSVEYGVCSPPSLSGRLFARSGTVATSRCFVSRCCLAAVVVFQSSFAPFATIRISHWHTIARIFGARVGALARAHRVGIDRREGTRECINLDFALLLTQVGARKAIKANGSFYIDTMSALVPERCVCSASTRRSLHDANMNLFIDHCQRRNWHHFKRAQCTSTNTWKRSCRLQTTAGQFDRRSFWARTYPPQSRVDELMCDAKFALGFLLFIVGKVPSPSRVVAFYAQG